MSDKDTTQTQERRGGERTSIEGTVTVQFQPQDVTGPGQNVSDEGVFFVADASVRVRILVDDGEEWQEGEVVRIQAMGEGRVGMAVRFVDA